MDWPGLDPSIYPYATTQRLTQAEIAKIVLGETHADESQDLHLQQSNGTETKKRYFMSAGRAKGNIICVPYHFHRNLHLFH